MASAEPLPADVLLQLVYDFSAEEKRADGEQAACALLEPLSPQQRRHLFDYQSTREGDPCGRTALSEAARLAWEGMVALLLRLRCPVTVQECSGRSSGSLPLHAAASEPGMQPPGPLLAVMRRLMDAGATVSCLAADRKQPLHYAAEWAEGRTEVMDFLLGRGADVNAVDAEGCSLLIIAAYRGDLPAMRFLLRRGARVDVADNDGETALHYVLVWTADEGTPHDQQEKHRLAMAERLLQAALAAAVAGQLVNRQNKDGVAALHLAGLHGMPSVARLLLEHGANPSLRREDDGTALHECAAKLNGQRLSAEQLQRRAEVVELLLQHGAEPGQRTGDGGTPLHWAADNANGQSTMLELLLRRGADINAVDKNDSTPLMSAVFQGDAAAAEFLLLRGAHAQTADRNGCTALHHAVARLDCDVSAADQAARRLELARLLLQHGADPGTQAGVRSNRRKPPLDLAREARAPALVQLLASRAQGPAAAEDGEEVHTGGRGAKRLRHSPSTASARPAQRQRRQDGQQRRAGRQQPGRQQQQQQEEQQEQLRPEQQERLRQRSQRQNEEQQRALSPPQQQQQVQQQEPLPPQAQEQQQRRQLATQATEVKLEQAQEQRLPSDAPAGQHQVPDPQEAPPSAPHASSRHHCHCNSNARSSPRSMESTSTSSSSSSSSGESRPMQGSCSSRRQLCSRALSMQASRLAAQARAPQRRSLSSHPLRQQPQRCPQIRSRLARHPCASAAAQVAPTESWHTRLLRRRRPGCSCDGWVCCPPNSGVQGLRSAARLQRS